MNPEILVSIVTYNDAAVLGRCLEALSGLDTPARIKVWDNASGDGSGGIAQSFGVSVTSSPENLGYCGGHNRNIAGEEYDYVLFMNADVVLSPDYFSKILPVLGKYPKAGMACGKLLRMDENGQPVTRGGKAVIDSTGIIFTRSQRHFDRGGNEVDTGQYGQAEPVFGGSGAALLCSRKLIEDLTVLDEFWDEDFFAFREDADLAWRAQLLGWQTIYVPVATALHQRHVLPERRSQLSPLINMHSVKNRFLMRSKNMDFQLWRHCFPAITLRDTGILIYILLREWSSIKAFRLLWKMRHRTREKRRIIQSRRKVYGKDISRWFI